MVKFFECRDDWRTIVAIDPETIKCVCKKYWNSKHIITISYKDNTSLEITYGNTNSEKDTANSVYVKISEYILQYQDIKSSTEIKL